jgi:hypothetical protein
MTYGVLIVALAGFGVALVVGGIWVEMRSRRNPFPPTLPYVPGKALVPNDPAASLQPQDQLPAWARIFVNGLFFMIPIILLVGGAWATGDEINLWRRHTASAQWPKTPATITHTEVTSYTTHSSKAGTHTYYHIHIEYSYTVDGRVYTSTRITFQDGDTRTIRDNPGKAYGYADKFVEGSTVEIWYNPEQPQDSILERRFSTTKLGSWLMFSLVVFFIGLAVVMVKVATKLKSRG